MKKRIMSLGLAVVLMISLVACKGGDVESYRESLSRIITEVQDMDAQVNEAVTAIEKAMVEQDKEAYQKQLDILKEQGDVLKEKYNAIANEKAPEEYAEDQKLLQEYAGKLSRMLDASMEMYEIGYHFTESGSASEEDNTRMTELQQEVMEMADAANGFDEVLNKVMGFGEE